MDHASKRPRSPDQETIMLLDYEVGLFRKQLVESTARVAHLEQTLIQSTARVTELEKTLLESAARVAELEKLLRESKAELEKKSTYGPVSMRLVEMSVHNGTLQQNLKASTDKTAKLQAENERLLARLEDANLLMDRLVPLGGGETAMDLMHKSLADLEQQFQQIKSLLQRVAAVHDARISKRYLTFREDKLAYDLSTMTAKYTRVLAKLKDTHSSLCSKDGAFLKSFGIDLEQEASEAKRYAPESRKKKPKADAGDTERL